MMSTTQSIYEDANFAFTPLCEAIRRKRCELAMPRRKHKGHAMVEDATDELVSQACVWLAKRFYDDALAIAKQVSAPPPACLPPP